MHTLEEVANVALRVPAIVLLDLLYRWDVEEFRGEFSHPSIYTSAIYTHLLWSVYCLAHVVCAVLLLLPLHHLVNIYLYLLTSLLLYVAHQTVRDYIRHEMDVGYSGAVYEDQKSLTRSVSTLTGLVILCTLCSLLMRTRQAWLFSAPVLPLLARLTGFPLHSLPLLDTVSTGATLLVMSYVAVSGFRPLFLLFTKAYEELIQAMDLYRLVALGMALWTQLAVPAVFLIFWVVLYLLHIYSALSSKPSILEQQGLVFILLNSVSECCGTPFCLLGLTSTVSYLALGMLNLCKFYLMGYAAFQNGNAMHRGVTEGVTMMLLSLQTGLLDLQVLQRTFLLSIIFFIVVTSTLQSMIEIADPIVLALAATGNRSVWRHVRGLSLCLFLLVFPTFMAYKIAYFFHMDFWLLILVSSCLLTSLQVLGTLFLYGLFMMELFQDSRVERMDEIIYGVNAVSRVLEFLVALCVVAYGTWESIFGEWSWMGVSVIIVHSYFNVWLRAQSGWRSFLLRREAARKISHLPRATEEELRAHNDVCSICFQEMSIAVITTCGHFFHADCLKKWLYVQDTCPLCHQLVRSVARDDEEENGEESDSDQTEAGGEGGIHPREEHEVRLQEENVKESQPRDHGAQTGMFISEMHKVVEEATYEQMELDSKKVDEVEHIVYLGLEEKQEEVYMEGSDREVLYSMEHKTEVSWSQEEVLPRQALTGRKDAEQILDHFLSIVKVPGEEEQVTYRDEKVLFKEYMEKQDEVLYGKQHEKKVSWSQEEEEKVLFKEYMEKQDEVLYGKEREKKVSQSQEEVLPRQEHTRRKDTEQVLDHFLSIVKVLREKEQVACREEKVFLNEHMEKQDEVLYSKQHEKKVSWSQEEGNTEKYPCREEQIQHEIQYKVVACQEMGEWEEVHIEKPDDEAPHKKQHEKKVSWSSEEVFPRQEKAFGYPCRENQMQDDLISIDKAPCRAEAMVLYQEEPEMDHFRWEAEEIQYKEEEQVACRGMEEGEEVYIEKQNDEVPHMKQHEKKVSWSQEEVSPRQEQALGYPSRENQMQNNHLNMNRAPCGGEAMVLYQEDQEMAYLRISGHLHSREAEEILYKEEEEVACRDMEVSCKNGGHVLYRGVEEESPCTQEENQEVPCTNEAFSYSKEERVPWRKPVKVLFKETEEVIEENPFTEDQEVVPFLEVVQVLYRDVVKEDPYREDQDLQSSTKPTQVIHRTVEEEDNLCSEVTFQQVEEDPYREHNEKGDFSKEGTCFLADKTGDDWTDK